jgi:hypothetical protein
LVRSGVREKGAFSVCNYLVKRKIPSLYLFPFILDILERVIIAPLFLESKEIRFAF